MMRVKILKHSAHTMTLRACSVLLKVWVVAHRPLRGQRATWRNPTADDTVALWWLFEAPPEGGGVFGASRDPISGTYLPLET